MPPIMRRRYPNYGRVKAGSGAMEPGPRHRRRRHAPITDVGHGPVHPGGGGPGGGAYYSPGGGVPGGGGADGQLNPYYSLDTDPILAAIRAQNQQMIANAEASAEAQRSKLLLQYGDPELARQFGGETQATAAEQNPFSILKMLQRQYEENTYGANEALNKSNLFYSSTRGTELGNLARALDQGRAEAGSTLQDALGGISQGLLDVRGQAQGRETDALNQAYQNQLQFALQYGAGPKLYPGAPGHGGGGPRRRRRRPPILGFHGPR